MLSDLIKQATPDLEIAKPADLEIAKLRKHEIEISEHSKAENTKRGYSSDWRKFVEWCLSVDLSPHPAEPDTIRLFLAYLDLSGKKPSAIGRMLTSIRQAHVLAGLENPVTEQVRETCKAIYRLRGTIKTKKSALTVDKLQRLLSFVGSDFLGLRDRAILLVGWTAALRRSEIVALDVPDIKEETLGLVLTVRRSKTDQEGRGKQIGLPFVDSDIRFCAARALKKWLSVAQITDGPIFRSIGKSGRGAMFACLQERLSEKGVSRIVKWYAEKAGYNPIHFGGHSLRSGLCTTLASIGIEERKIMMISGHKSLPMLREYIQSGELFTQHPILAVFAKAPSAD